MQKVGERKKNTGEKETKIFLELIYLHFVY